MDQGVITGFKNYYHFKLMKKLVQVDSNLINSLVDYQHKRCYLFSIEAWDAVKQTSLIRTWHKLLSGDADDNVCEGFENTETCVAELQLILHCATADFRNVGNDIIREWI